MESHGSSSPLDAAAALELVRSGRSAAARRVTTPWWYHPLVGVALAAMVGSGSLTGAVRVAVLLSSAGALVALLWLYRRLTGLWVNAHHVPGTRRATTLAVVSAMVVLVVANVLEDALDVRGSLVAGGVVLGVAYVVFWRWVERQLVQLWQAQL